MIIFMPLTTASGRVQYQGNEKIDREKIINALVDSKIISGYTTNHFHPIPFFKPLGIGVHPDCAVISILAKNDSIVEPMDNYIDFDKLLRLTAGAKSRFRINIGALIFVIHFFRAIKKGKTISVMKMLFGYIFKKGKSTFILIMIEQFMDKYYQDVQRLKQCTGRIVLADGKLMPICIYNHPDKERSKFTRENSNSNH
jgi:hypothetical protein